jgi:lysophospholipase L1-like esterase
MSSFSTVALPHIDDMPPRHLFSNGLIIFLNTLLLLALLEGGLRVAYWIRNSTVDVMVLPYTAAQDWGTLPPWIDGLRILEDDPVLLWRNRPGARRAYLDVYAPAHDETDRIALIQQFIPRVPELLRGQPRWDVAISSQGFREREFTREKASSTFRIICLGDSWTFGANVNQKEAYPQRLASLLAERYPEARFEVLNLGVMGYTSRQGLELLRRQVLDLQPDLILVGFGMNDAIVQGWRDKDAVGRPNERPNRRRWQDHLESYKLVRFWQARALHKPWTIGDYLHRVAKDDGTPDAIWTGRQASEAADYDKLEAIVRVSPKDYEVNLGTIIDLARSRGADAIVMFNELWSTPYQAAAEKVARSKQTPFVNSKALIDGLRQGAERELETRLGLQATSEQSADRADGLVEVVFRVHADRWPVPTALYIAGNHPSLGDQVPNRVALHDDGTGGDQRAGDGVWSYTGRFAPGTRLFYVYTNSGREGHWEGVDIPDLRFLVVPSTGPVYRPIEAFGSLRFQADGWHTNAVGYDLIARTVADVLDTHANVRAHVARRGERNAP